MIVLTFPGGLPTPKDFGDWLRHASPGDVCEYFRGDLAGAAARDPAVRILAQVVRNSASPWAQRDLLLFQERLAPNVFRYLAFKVSKRCMAALRGLADPRTRIVSLDQARRNAALAREAVSH